MAIAPLLPGTSLLPDTTVEGGYRFRIEAVLGSGGFGITYHAVDLQLDARVVVKELAISEICSRETIAAGIEPLPRCETEFRYWKDRFFDEARRANQIRHPHVVRVIAVWRERGTVYYAMEEVRGARSLPCSTHAGWRQPEWTLARARSLALLEALAAVHATGLLHGDIKPSNVLLDHDDQLVLIDFGTARRIGELNNTATSTMFTPGYAPPELMIGSRVREAGPWSDLYSWAMLTLGMMIYHPTSDQQPLSALTRMQLLQYGGQDPYASLAQDLLDAGVSEGWTTVLLSCIAINPLDRLQSVASVLDVLGNEGLAPDTLPASIRQAQMTSSATVPLPQLDAPAPRPTDASQRGTPRPPRADQSAFAQTVADTTTTNDEQPSERASISAGSPPSGQRQSPDPTPAPSTALPKPHSIPSVGPSTTSELPRGASTFPALPTATPAPQPAAVAAAGTPASQASPLPETIATPHGDAYVRSRVSPHDKFAVSLPAATLTPAQSASVPNAPAAATALPDSTVAPWQSGQSTSPPLPAPSAASRTRRPILLAASLVAALLAFAAVIGWPRLTALLSDDLSGSPETDSTPDTATDSSDSGVTTTAPLNGSAEGSATPATSLAPNIPPGFVRVPPGTFTMGSHPQETGRKSNETLRNVTLTRHLAVQVNEVTHEQWRDLMGTSPWFFTRCGPDCPVERVSWYDAIAWANALSISEGLSPCYTLDECTGQAGSGLTTPLDSNSPAPGDYRCANVTFAGLDCSGYRLPTEAEWEYIARAGTTGAWWGADAGPPSNTGCDAAAPIRAAAWYECNAHTDYFSPIRVGSGDSSTRVGPHPVGTVTENPFQLKDMLGNVAEWTHDGSDQPNTGDSTDPIGQGGSRTVRGGHFRSPALELRAAARNLVAPDIRSPDIGFRVVRTLPAP
jgi:formylglycine-generating enzyme required for sulfatase activity/serine/threonine protein kinase